MFLLKRTNGEAVFVEQLEMANQSPGEPAGPYLQADFDVSFLSGLGEVC